MKIIQPLIAIVLLISGCQQPKQEQTEEETVVVEETEPSYRVDHLVVGVPQLELGIKKFESMTGVTPVIGGEHPGAGTRNALVSLGNGTYLELIAPQQTYDTLANPFVAELLKLRQPTCLTFAVYGEDLEKTGALVERAGYPVTEPLPGSRVKPDGVEIKWETIGVQEFGTGTVPFFIRWENMDIHPSKTSPEGCTLQRMTISTSDTERLSTLVKDLGLPADVIEGEEGIELLLMCDGRLVRI